MGKSNSELHSNTEVKLEIADDMKPSLDESKAETSLVKTSQDEYDRLCTMVNAIAHPLASRKVAKKIYKLVRKAGKGNQLRQGLSDVNKSLRKDERGIVILAGDVSPIDVYSHIPSICEEKDIPYMFTPSRQHLGLATGRRKRAAIILLVKEHTDYADLFREVRELIMTTPPDY
ncbi:unnamed protein product [Thelazia callipaeda]|uniref:H/ACA ribonucleoprotein complex subunit 2 n=1 Tax=Thelazia callipaeda TaxID=103827 RepID=A0A0N5D3Q0_THECL|nr:unnamed protein product [Thelazia callipaeda]